IIIFFFYLDNRTFNQLTDDQTYPMVDEPKNHPVSLTESSLTIPDSGVHMTKLYTLQNNENLFMGIWYRNRNKWMNQNEEKWKRNDGDMQLLVKAVDENGTTFNGKTKEAVHGTFSTFQYIHFNSFNYSEESKKLEFYFYPIVSKGKEEEPAARPVFHVSVPVSTVE
ncbi:hypothetical protein, partial [Halobacillus sp. BBL2006]|uniref:hypothetical protein n=1 Tax=Halobacillus sp. BBL2006 TaxID=1543706 RepID=UPI000542A746